MCNCEIKIFLFKLYFENKASFKILNQIIHFCASSINLLPMNRTSFQRKIPMLLISGRLLSPGVSLVLQIFAQTRSYLVWEAREAIWSELESRLTTALEAAILRRANLGTGRLRLAHVCGWKESQIGSELLVSPTVSPKDRQLSITENPEHSLVHSSVPCQVCQPTFSSVSLHLRSHCLPTQIPLAFL